MVKEQLTVTVETEIIRQLDKLLETGEFRSRSHVVEYLLNKGIKKVNHYGDCKTK